MIQSTLCYIEKDDQYLMMHRGKKPDDPNAGKWIGIGGKFEAGETAEECMLREVREETGIELTEYQFHGVIRFRSDAWEYEDMYLYSAKAPEAKTPEAKAPAGAAGQFPSGTDALPDCREGDLQWIPKEDILDLPLWEGDKLFLRELIAGKDKIEMTLIYEEEKLVGHY